MSVTRKWPGLFYDKGGAVYNVKHPDFGAVGDGVADDTAAIQAAITAAGGETNVFLPPGDYLITSTISLAENQILRGARRSTINNSAGSRILFRPSGADTVAFRNAVGANNCGLEDIEINLNDNTRSGVSFTTSYANRLVRVIISGTFDIGVHLYDTYVCRLEDVSTEGASAKRFILYGLNCTALMIRGLHTSNLPNDSAVNLCGIALRNVTQSSIIDPILQGVTTGISLRDCRCITIINPRFENTLSCVRVGDDISSSNTTNTTFIGGSWGGPLASHPQYASRGPLLWLVQSQHNTLINLDFRTSSVSDSALWPILTSTTTGGHHEIIGGSFHNSTHRNEIFREASGASPSFSIIGATYGSNVATEMILKCDGSFGGNSYGIRVNNAGALSTVAWTPALIAGSVSSLLAQELTSITAI